MVPRMGIWEKTQRFLDRLESRWALILVVGGSSAVTTWLAFITDWINALGPIAWAAAFFAGAIVSAFSFWLFAMAYGRFLLAKETREYVSKTGANPLDKNFDGKLVKISAFYSREYVPHKNKRFRNCNVSGPGNIVIFNTISMYGCDFRHCQIVIVNPIQTLFGVTIFEDCIFDDCTMTNLTFFMPPVLYEGLDGEMRRHIPVVSLTPINPDSGSEQRSPQGTAAETQP